MNALKGRAGGGEWWNPGPGAARDAAAPPGSRPGTEMRATGGRRGRPAAAAAHAHGDVGSGVPPTGHD